MTPSLADEMTPGPVADPVAAAEELPPVEPAATEPSAPLLAYASTDRAHGSRDTGHLPDLPTEGVAKRMAFLLAAVVITIGYAVAICGYWQPVHTGTDQNGYLVGGKMFAQTLSLAQEPRQLRRPDLFDPHAYVASMWVTAADDPHAFYPKYPLGLPLIYAICLWVGGAASSLIAPFAGPLAGVRLAYMISPAAMTLAVLGVFFLVRQFAGSFPGVLAMTVFATSPTTSNLAINPNSHATTVCCVVWGMICLLHWWRRGGRFWAIAAGLLVGYAATIRYTEGALILPLAWVALVRLRPIRPTVALLAFGGAWLFTSIAVVGIAHADAVASADFVWPTRALGIVALLFSGPTAYHVVKNFVIRPRREWAEAALVLLAWAAPIAVLLAYNWLAMGTLTGYDATNESTGFSWAFFYDNWETILRQLNVNGLFLVMPLAIAGLIAMFWWNWHVAAFVWLWTLPCLTIYTFYYWAPDSVGYLRFVLTILPPMLVGGYWLIAHLRDVLPPEVPSEVPHDASPESPHDSSRHSSRHAPAAAVPLYLLLIVLTLGALATAAAGYFGMRFDFATHTLVSVHDYLQQQGSSFLRLGGWPGFVASVVMLGALGAAVSASALLRRAIVPTLAAGAVTFFSVAVQADDSAAQFEKDSYDRTVLTVTADLTRTLVPDGAVLICREEGLDNHLQFITNDRIYTGLTFDRNWVNNRPQAATADPVLIDPVRGQQLIEALKGFDQNALNEQARTLVSSALLAKRRVFVLEATQMAEMQKATREKKEGPVPDFVRRYINNKPKDKTLLGKRVTWWDVPIVVKDDVKPQYRGRRESRPNYRVASYQLWEITAGT